MTDITSTKNEFELAELRDEALREVQMRKEVYTRASGGGLFPIQRKRIAMMVAIAQILSDLEVKGRLL